MGTGFRAGGKLIGAIVVIAGLAYSGAAAAEEVIDLTIDFARLLPLDKPFKDILIGNSGIADATVKDDNSIVLTGKAAGTTNLIVLDEEGNEIKNATLRVSSNVKQLTTIFYGSQRQTFSCAATCEQVILVGDDVKKFQDATSQIQSRQAFANGQ